MKLSEVSKKDLLILGHKILRELLERKKKDHSVFTSKPKKMKKYSKRYYNEIMRKYFSKNERKFLETPPEKLEEAKKMLEKQVLLYKEVPAEDKGPYKYVCHHHWRGKSCHTDLRIIAKRGEYAIGWTIDDLIKGAIKEPVTTMKEARRIEKEGKAFKINWETGKFALRRTAAGQVKPTELRAHEKARIPIEWMEVQGVAPAGTVGATKEFPGVFIIIDKGKAQYLTQKPAFHEYWMDGTLKGRLVFRRLEQKAFESLVEKGILPEYILNSFNASLAYVNKELSPTEVNWVPLTKNGCIVFRKSDLRKIILPPSEVPEGKPRVGVFWVAIQPIVQVPYVISRRAVNKKWVPPKGFSALPLKLKKKVPDEFKYWTKESKSERRKIRDAYFEYLKKQPKKEKSETECPKVRVTERIVKEKVWTCPYCNEEILEKSLYYDEKKDKWYHRPCFDKGPIELPKDDRVLCQNCWKIVNYLDEPEVCMGAIKCPYCGATIDQTGKVAVKPEKKVGTFPFALHWHWWRGPIVVRRGPSEQHWDVRIDNGEMPFPHFQCTENPAVIDKTTCVYKPCKVKEALKWNGSIAPAGVTKELVEVTVIERVDETAEGQIYTVKDKKGDLHTSKPVRFPRLKKDDKVWMDHLERLWTIVNPDANPTKNTPAYSVLIDDGKAEVLEDSDLFKKVRFKGKNLKGIYTYIREDPKTDIWVMEKSGLPGEER